MHRYRAASILTWAYAAGFGIPAIPVAWYVYRTGTLPWLGDLFPMYGGPWSARVGTDTLILLLIAFAVVAAIVALVAWRVWSGSRAAVWLSLLLLPVEAVFWFGFALPIPWVLGAARLAVLVAALRRPATAHSRSRA